MGRWLIQLSHKQGVPHYYGGKRMSGGSVWISRRNFATKFLSQEEAESYALIIAAEEPEVLSKLSVVNYDDAKDGAPSMDDRQARR